jgi:hypothetical protein
MSEQIQAFLVPTFPTATWILAATSPVPSMAGPLFAFLRTSLCFDPGEVPSDRKNPRSRFHPPISIHMVPIIAAPITARPFLAVSGHFPAGDGLSHGIRTPLAPGWDS